MTGSDDLARVFSFAGMLLQIGDAAGAAQLLEQVTPAELEADPAVRVATAAGLSQAYTRLGRLDAAEASLVGAFRVLSNDGAVLSAEVEMLSARLFDFYVAQGRQADAMAALCQGLVQGPRALWRELAGLTQLGREQAVRRHRAQVDRALSNLLRWRDQPAAAGAALDLLLWRRNFGLEPYRAANRAAGRDPSIGAKVAELRAIRAAAAELRFSFGAIPNEGHGTRITIEGIRREPEIDALEAAIFSSLIEEDFAPAVDPPNHPQVAEALPADCALIEYWRCRVSGANDQTSPRYLAAVLRGDGAPPVLVDVCAADAIEQDLVNRFQAAVSGGPVDGKLPRSAVRALAAVDDDGNESGEGWLSSGAELRAIVFDPLVSALEGVSRLFMVPDGVLTKISFATLPNASRFLIDEYEISYLMSGREVRAAPPTREAGRPLVVAAPAFDLGLVPGSAARAELQFADLPGTLTEAGHVAARLGVTPVVGADAVRRAILDCRSPSILHVSTHGLLLPVRGLVAEMDWRAPPEPGLEVVGTVQIESGLGRLSGIEIEDQALRSMLVLAGVNAWLAGVETPAAVGTGWLNAEDIAGLDLGGTEMVVLSACETGVGVIQIGEAVLGIRTAFFTAGARTVVSTLWKVPDDVTAAMIDDFYGRRAADPSRPAAALRAAQLAVRTPHPDRPGDWGAFICHAAVRTGVQQ